MSILLFESIAFGISIIAFLYGVIKVFIPNVPIYYKMIISAVGCYVLEELWVIVNALCGVENDTFSIRLIGIIGCYCTFLTANSRALTNLLGKDVLNNRKSKYLALIAPAAIFALSFAAILKVDKSKAVIMILVFLPLIVDSYYELKCLLTPMDDKGLLKQIKIINALVLIEYAISMSYTFVQELNVLLVMDVISAIGMALIVLASRKGAIKWKISI
ncbi:MAG: hypothetical protein MJ125_03815 [Clostridia bacterium]|nr:hypothetical protein [Clostridia bacterium]